MSVQLIFAVSGIVASAIHLVYSDTNYDYQVFSIMTLLIFLFMVYAPDIQNDPELDLLIAHNEIVHIPLNHHVDILCSIILFFVLGCNETVIFFLEDFIYLNIAPSDVFVSQIYLCFCISLATASAIFIYIQSYLNTNNILHFLFVSIILQSLFAIIILISPPHHTNTILTSILCYGFFSSSSLSILFDVSNRYSYPTIVSSALLLVGLNLGAGLVPYIVANLCAVYGTSAIFSITALLTLLCSFLVPLISKLSYIKVISIHSTLKSSTNSLLQENQVYSSSGDIKAHEGGVGGDGVANSYGSISIHNYFDYLDNVDSEGEGSYGLVPADKADGADNDGQITGTNGRRQVGRSVPVVVKSPILHVLMKSSEKQLFSGGFSPGDAKRDVDMRMYSRQKRRKDVRVASRPLAGASVSGSGEGKEAKRSISSRGCTNSTPGQGKEVLAISESFDSDVGDEEDHHSIHHYTIGKSSKRQIRV